MEYLTTHDIVWINSSITGGTSPFNYVTLEAAMAGQYSYGQSQDVPGQAANLLARLVLNAPFQGGNLRTALVATLSFLNANGYATRVADSEAAELVSAVAQRTLTASEAVSRLSTPSAAAVTSVNSLRKLIALECNTHSEALALLAGSDA